MKEGRKEGRKDERKEYRNTARKHCTKKRKDSRKEGTKDGGRKGGRIEGKGGRREGRNTGILKGSIAKKKEGFTQRKEGKGRKEGRREEGKEGREGTPRFFSSVKSIFPGCSKYTPNPCLLFPLNLTKKKERRKGYTKEEKTEKGYI